MAHKYSKRYSNIAKTIDQREYDSLEGFEFLLKNSASKDSIDVVFSLDIDPRKSDQIVKGIVKPPFGLGKKITIVVFTDDTDNIENLKQAGATYVGNEELAEKVKNKEITADVYLASKEIMTNKISKIGLASILKSQMPNLKSGTIVDNKDLEQAVAAQKKGQIAFRSNGRLVQTSIGRAGFKVNELLENFNKLKEAINMAKPQVIKTPTYIKKIFISSTMSPSIKIKLQENQGK